MRCKHKQTYKLGKVRAGIEKVSLELGCENDSRLASLMYFGSAFHRVGVATEKALSLGRVFGMVSRVPVYEEQRVGGGVNS